MQRCDGAVQKVQFSTCAFCACTSRSNVGVVVIVVVHCRQSITVLQRSCALIWNIPIDPERQRHFLDGKDAKGKTRENVAVSVVDVDCR